MLLASSPGLTSATSTSFSISVPSLGNVQPLGVIPASQPLAGLGFNIDPLNEWEFQLAAAAGTTHVRFQCGWNATETQTAPPQNQNTSTPYVLQSDCQSGLALAKKYGMHPTIIAAYGSPYHAILSVAVPGGALPRALPVSMSNSHLELAATPWRLLSPFTDTIIAANGSQISRAQLVCWSANHRSEPDRPNPCNTNPLLPLSPQHCPPTRPRSTPSASTCILLQPPSAPPTLL